MWSEDEYNDLYHWGIKGQKWGVRRYQNKDGTLTAEGKNRYSDDKSTKEKSGSQKPAVLDMKRKDKSGHRLKLEKQYREKGLSEQEAVLAADKRIKVEKAIAVSAGVTVAAATAYYAKNKWTETYCDQVLKAGTQFHNLDSIANERPGEHLYVNYRQNDTNFFRGQFALGKLKRTGHVFNHVIEANEDIKIPSLNTRKNVFKQLYDKDPEFRKTLQEHSQNMLTGDLSKASADKVYKKMWQKMGDKDDPEFNVAKRKYYEALRQKGYEAIVDEWDTKSFVYRADAPLILLNTSSKSLGQMTIKELTDRDILISQANSKNYALGRTFLNTMYLPHTNHFNESNKHLSKYSKRDELNTKYVEKALSEMKKAGKDDAYIRNYTLEKDGDILADVGKYMSKNKNMTVTEAETKAMLKSTGKNFIAASGLLSLSSLPIFAVSQAAAEVKAEQYIKDHPNTKMTVAEIERKIANGQL